MQVTSHTSGKRAADVDRLQANQPDQVHVKALQIDQETLTKDVTITATIGSIIFINVGV